MWLGSQREGATEQLLPLGSIGFQPHTGIPKPEQQKREREPTDHQIVGINGDLVFQGDSWHRIPGKKQVLGYNTSLESLLVSAGGDSRTLDSWKGLSRHPVVNLMSQLFSERVLSREQDRDQSECPGKEVWSSSPWANRRLSFPKLWNSSVLEICAHAVELSGVGDSGIWPGGSLGRSPAQ